MNFTQIYFEGLLFILGLFTLVWIYSIKIRNVSIVDIFWGFGFVLLNAGYFYKTGDYSIRKLLMLFFVTVWGLRLSIHLYFRNKGKVEDFRYREFRKRYGEKRYWWFSFFQVFLLQGILLWLISAPLLAVQFYSLGNTLKLIDFVAIFLWLVGFTFEAGGDFQLKKFKAYPENKGQLLQQGFWKYTRHPNYFGDAAVWWSFGLFSIASGSYFPVAGSILLTWLIIKVSGVSMLEKTLSKNKNGYNDYITRTSAFLPWFPKTVKS